MSEHNHLRTGILIAFAVETLSVTWLLKIPGITGLLSILYFIAGTTIAVLLLYAPTLQLPRPLAGGLRNPINHSRMLVIGLMALMIYTLCGFWFDEIPLDINYADMLPIIKVMASRFASGHWKNIYDPISEIWHGTQPIYLPSMWQPFTLAVILGIDMRWITVLGVFFAFGLFLFIYRPDYRRYQSVFLGVLGFILFWWLFADNTPGVITVSEEGVVIAYYALLVLALLYDRIWLIGVAASLCMLSRYALVGWLPAFFLYLLLTKRGKEAIVFSLTGLICLLFLFVFPVGWSTFIRLLTLPGNYIQFAKIVWKDSPDVFSTGVGFAGMFGPGRILLLHRLLILFSFAVPLLFILFCWFRSRKRVLSNIPLATLKISLVVFYSFIDVPYLYLFYTSSIVSLLAIAAWTSPRETASGQ